MKRGKKYVEAAKTIDRGTLYDVADAVSLVKKTATAKFDETIEAHIRTGCDGRHADQQIRGAVVLPNGTGKKVRVLVFAKGDKAEEAVAAGVMTAATDGAYRKVADHNPWQRFMVLWSDARISADLTCYMNAYNDPRREAYYDKSTFGTVSGNAYTGEESYVGLRRGILQGQYNSWSQGSSCMKVTTSDNIVVFRASEVAFLRAEGALRNWNMGGTAKDFYEEGIRLSFEENGITSGVENYLASTGKVEAYKDPLKGQSAQTYDYSGAINTNVTVAWSGGDFEKSLEQIITQKWIANFPNGMESWTEYRRTGYPKLMPMAANASGGIVNDAEGARRMPYPTDEYRENRESVEAAVATLTQESKTKRGDTMATHVWWDCK